MESLQSVSYTHLYVYKRQVALDNQLGFCGEHIQPIAEACPLASKREIVAALSGGKRGLLPGTLARQGLERR